MITPTKMMERELLREAETQPSPGIELTDDHEGLFTPPPELPPKKGKGRPKKASGGSKGNNNDSQNVIKTDNVETTVVPAKPYKFDKETRAQLADVFVYSTRLMDTVVDMGLGIDTSLVPIWEISPEEADVFVRIMERRAARSEVVRDKVIPKMLEGRDYIEAGMIVMPRAITTIKTVVEQGGPKPRMFGKKGGQ